MQSQHSCSGRLYGKRLVLLAGIKCRRVTCIDWVESFHKTRKDPSHLHAMAVWELVWSELAALWPMLQGTSDLSWETTSTLGVRSPPALCTVSAEWQRPQAPQPRGIFPSFRPDLPVTERGEEKKNGERKVYATVSALRTEDFGPWRHANPALPMGTGDFKWQKETLSRSLLSGRLAPWHHHRDRGMWICAESKKSSTQRMGAWGTLSVCLVVAAFTKAQSSPGIPVNPSSHQLHNGWVWEASKERQKDSHSPKVPSELLSWKFKGSHNTWGCWYTSFGISIVKIKNGITSHENELSLEGTEQRHIESNCKGEEHPKGTHPVFPTKVLPSAKRGRLPSPTGRERGRFPARLPCCSAGQRKPVIHLLSSPASTTGARRLGCRWTAGSGWQHSTGSRCSRQVHGPLHGLRCRGPLTLPALSKMVGSSAVILILVTA